MSLKFAIRDNKREHARITILRPIIRKTDTGDRVDGYDTLGSLKGLDRESIEIFAQEKQLTERELFALENHAGQLAFNKHDLNDSLESPHRETILWSKPYEEALYQLWQLAKANNIPFCPTEIMQKSLLTKAKSVERKLNDILKTPLNILDKVGLDIHRVDDDEHQKKVRTTCRKLFSLLLKTGAGEEILATAFNQIAAMYYNKKEVLKPHYLKDYATNIRKLPFWYNTVAIDLLLMHGKNPLGPLSIEAVVENWLRLRKEKMTPEEALKTFKKTFHPSPEDEPILKSVIQKEYAKGLAAD